MTRSRSVIANPARSPSALPTGTVTFLFSDIEGSTRLARSLPPEQWAALLEGHEELVDATVAANAGVVVKHEGDGVFAAFQDTSDAIAAAAGLSAGVASRKWPAGVVVRLRVGIHTGAGNLTRGAVDYVGVDVHYAARLAAAGNGGQVLISDATARALTRSLPDGSSIVSDGPRRLKDFEEPRLLHRLVIPGVADDERPLRTLGGSDLPEILTSFVGRGAELAVVVSLVESSRVVTLTGPGGTGKTRLALSVASAIRADYPDGIAFVELAPVSDAHLLPGAIASSLGITAAPEVPILQALEEALSGRRMLLVLDNLEQLLPVAAATVASLIRAAPRVHILISSREALRVAGEQEYPVPPLALGDAEGLFIDRARLVVPGYSATRDDLMAIAAIAERVGGLPLAIELAAARVKLFGPREILERLDRSFDVLSARARDIPERQRNLRATIGWSHDLLAPSEQIVFRRMAAMVGDWTPEVAEAIVAADPASGLDVLDGLASLVDKSLLRTSMTEHGSTQFGWHVFVREFAAEQLTEAGERLIVERRHGEIFRDLARSAGPHLVETDATRQLDLIDHAIHDLRQAMTWSLATGEPDVGMWIIGSAWRWWQLRLNLREGRDWAARLLGHPAARTDSLSRVEALAAAGGLAYWSMDYPATRTAYEERLAIAERLGDRRQIADAHYDLGFVGMVENDLAFLRREEEAALALFQALGDEPGVIRSRQALVLALYLAGDSAAALALEDQNLSAFRRTQAGYRISDSLMLLAAIHRQAKDPVAALARAREAIHSLSERMGGSTIGALGVIAIIEGESGDAELAARLTGAIRAIQAETGEALAPVAVLHLPNPEAIVRKRLGSGLADRLIAQGARLSADEAIRLALGESKGA